MKTMASAHATLDKLEAIDKKVPTLTNEQKNHIRGLVRASVVDHLAFTNLSMVLRHYGSSDLRCLAWSYASEVRDDIARTLGA